MSTSLSTMQNHKQSIENTPALLLQDSYGRQIRYLRLSVTDRCNLRCLYCWGCGDMKFIPHEKILTYEEMASIVDVAVESGVEKIRLTGGEPLVRKNLLHLIELIRKKHEHVDIRITTNGTLLKNHAQGLSDLGVSTINLSLDTFNRQVFHEVTGRDYLPQVMEGMEAALNAGLALKINAVALRGVNDKELPTFVDYARNNPVDVRFIEFMPMGCGTRWSDANFWSSSDIVKSVAKLVNIEPFSEPVGIRGPARLFKLEGGLGRFGVISPLSNHFCGDCNRLRVTSDGRLRTCLFDDHEYHLRHILRHPKLGLEAVRRVIHLANMQKPLGYRILCERKRGAAVADRKMTSIGG